MEKSNFPLLGTRRYIHSTTLWRYVINKLTNTDITQARLLCKKRLHGQVDIYCKQGEIPAIEDSNAEMYVNTNEGMYVFSFKANGESIDKSVPYDEDKLLGEHVLDTDKREIILKNVSKEWLINSLVAASKTLMLKCLSNEGMTSWAVGKISLDWKELEDIASDKQVQLRLSNVLSNRYAKVVVYVEGKKYGAIESARWRK